MAYAVIWRTPEGRICSGRLVVTGRNLRLDGADRAGGSVRDVIDRAEVASVEMGRSPADRIDGLVSVIVTLRDETRVAIASPTGLGLIHEIADDLHRPGDDRFRRPGPS